MQWHTSGVHSGLFTIGDIPERNTSGLTESRGGGGKEEKLRLRRAKESEKRATLLERKVTHMGCGSHMHQPNPSPSLSLHYTAYLHEPVFTLSTQEPALVLVPVAHPPYFLM